MLKSDSEGMEAAAGNEGLALRFPRIVGLRQDKSPTDATTEDEIISLYELQKKTHLTEEEQ
jgi:DNA ligase-1